MNSSHSLQVTSKSPKLFSVRAVNTRAKGRVEMARLNGYEPCKSSDVLVNGKAPTKIMEEFQIGDLLFMKTPNMEG